MTFYESVRVNPKKTTMKKVTLILIMFFIGLAALEGLGETAQMNPAIPPTIPMVQKAGPPPAPSSPPLAAPVPSGPATQSPPIYNPTGKPDPFMPTRVTIETAGMGKKKVLPLEQFEVGDFELVGVFTGNGTKKAVVQDLTGKGFFIQVGTRIGKMGGTVIRISEKEVYIREPFRDFLGRISSKVIILKLPQTQYGNP
jgi:type IV pilus assembly protein PilP